MEMNTGVTNQSLGELISARRLERNRSIADLARASGLTHSYWSKLESGQIRTPAPKYLRLIASTLDIPLGDLQALTDYVTSDSLPSFKPYMRAKYNDLPPEAIVQLEGYFHYLRQYYGIPEDQPVYPPKSKIDHAGSEKADSKQNDQMQRAS
jgi:transcriptional regulator with XRE-family HTH domain